MLKFSEVESSASILIELLVDRLDLDLQVLVVFKRDELFCERIEASSYFSFF